MSWFDATGFANLAKTALKEAQKTIDKALDITEEDSRAVNKSSLSSPMEGTRERIEPEGVPRSESEPQLSTNQSSVHAASLWGSFSGSFFENPKTQEQDVEQREPPIRPTSFIAHRVEKPAESESPVVYRKKEARNCNDRLSAISSERSSSSLEVLGSCTPESEPAPSLSSSSSVVRLRQSGSFESLTSPSSVEVIRSDSPEASEASETLTSGTVLDLPTCSPEVSLNAGASSCEEGTLMGSSCEENTIVASSSSASYLKTLIADAMTEQNICRREQSPISSESRSDMIKVGSSGHTSGDELETTTSSDIEIISSPTPNGDSGSTASRHSPARSLCRSEGLPDAFVRTKLDKPRGGRRVEISEAASDNGSEVEKLFKRISEMTDMLEEKEAKLVDLGRVNSDLRDSNDYLKGQLETRLKKQDVTQMSEDFTKRLATLECKFQQAIREKEQLRLQIDKAKATETATEGQSEKDQTIRDLRSEGEKLSKQQLTLNNLIKKLRATEKENQKVIISLREKLEESDREVERCKKALAAKQEVERTQIEAVHQLTRANQRLEAEAAALRTHVDGLTAAVAEGDKARAKLESESSAARARAEDDVRRELEAERGDRDRLERRAAELEEELTELQRDRQRDVEEWRKERLALERRLESAVAEAERAAQSVSTATRPLMRQLDAANAAHAQSQATWEQREHKLLVTVEELESRVSVLTDSERAEREQVIAANTRCSSLETRLSASQRDLASSLTRTREADERLAQRERSLERMRREREEEVGRLEAELCDKRRECLNLEQQLAVERAALEAERRKTCATRETAKESPPPPGSPPSPTLSLGRLSLADSTVTEGDLFDTYSACGRLSCTTVEGLQAQLKQREGEVCQLQWEAARREAERTTLSDRLAAVTALADDRQLRLTQMAHLRTEYDALLLLYGEKLEECQELRMDLHDVKDAYKTQIDQLLTTTTPHHHHHHHSPS